MKRLFVLMFLVVFSQLVRAQGPDDQYITIYNQIQEGDLMVERGENARALAKYTEAQAGLKAFQTNNPDWYSKVVKYRLNYLASKIAQLAPVTPPPGEPAKPSPAEDKTAKPPAKLPATPPEPAKSAASNAYYDNQIKALQEQIHSVEADRALLEAKLKEALAAQPAAADPRELARAQAQIRDLQKENELLKASLAEAKTNAVQAGPAAEETRKALEEANRKVARLTEANSSLTMEREAMQARVKALAASPDSATAALREENEILKKELASIKNKEAAAPQDVNLNQKLQEAQSQLAVLQSEQEIWRLEKVALQNQLKDRPPVQPLVINPRPAGSAPPPPAVDQSAEKIRQLEAQRDELQKSLATANKLISGSRKSREMATHIADMTREMADLRSRIDVLEAHPVPYTADELALLTQPDSTTLVAEAVHHSASTKPSRESSKLAILQAEAKQYWVAHDLVNAEQKYLEMVKLDPKNASLLADLASIQSDRGHAADAEKNLKAALAIAPNDDYSLFILGVLKLREEKYDESLDAFSRAAEVNPQNAKIQNYIGITLSEKGVRGPAEAAFRKAIQIDPAYGDAHANLAFVYLTQKPPLVELARWHYKKALEAGHARDPGMEKLMDKAKPSSAQ